MSTTREAFDNPKAVEQQSNDVELEGLTLYQKKSVLINRELDAMGMGRYQWMIFLLCGFGYLLDLLWAQAFGLIASPLQQELGFSETEIGNIFTSFSAGLTAGAFVWGVLVDIVGRRWAFNFTVLCASIFGLCLGAPDTYDAILVLTAFTGFGIGGNIPIDTTITLEFLPQNRRYLLATLSVFQPIGVVVCSGIAYGFIPSHSCASDLKSCKLVASGEPCCTKASNYGWRYLTFTLGAITIFIFLLRFVVFRFQESPKFLLYRGQDEQAVKVVQHVAKVNKRPCNLTTEMLEALTDDTSSNTSSSSTGVLILGSGTRQSSTTFREKLNLEFQRYKLLFSSFTIARLTVLVWIIYAFDYWGFTIAGSYLPTVLLKKNAALGIGIRETYRDYVYIYLFGIPGVALGAIMYRGRWLGMLISSLLMGASLFIFAAVDSEATYIGINGMEYFFQSMFNAILYGWTPENFPAPIRGTACGVASFWGRLFSIVSPLIAAHVLVQSTNGVLYLAGAGVFVSSVAIALLPRKIIGEQSY
ncbi:putative membrane transporter [Phaeomoniella chlamydospora]|uniref:Putative membrane transporter n=1 Tax=Phaeomoniella chlamydospora TaxID=158046 RepID=A0A0G2H8P1_PHACM|nr:putative membrane transporter [Phaeomoniella chlamydospora]